MGTRKHIAGKNVHGSHTTIIDSAELPVKVLQSLGVSVAPLRINMRLKRGNKRFALIDYGQQNWRLFVRGTSSSQELRLIGFNGSFTELSQQFKQHKKIIKSRVMVTFSSQVN